MSGLGDMTFENFKKDVCTRCDTLYDLRRRENIVNNIFERYEEELFHSDQTDLKYEVGAEGVKTVFKNRCAYVDKCEEVQELLEKLSQCEERLSKLLLWLMQDDREQEVFYISSDIDPFYPMLSNRIIRCDLSKKAVLRDKYDTKELLEKFQPNINNNNNNN